MKWLTLAWGGIWPRVAAIGGAVLAVLAILFKARQSGKEAVRVEGMKETLEAVKVRDETKREVDGLSDTELNDRLQRGGWLRD